ncbi:hypothetical protein C1H76_5645 [Elsinoe australis]|uniref:Rhodopsin domain-containing protein n=1 Tax=Elsinoe australis TaxID=40998 RepID=A0A4U7AVJ9_9PEZI|nr:hypothetical protein C1H76_5645 [Elsinoe australis]
MPALFSRNADGSPVISASDEANLGPHFLRVSITLAVFTFLIACHRVVFVWVKRGFLGIEEIILAVAVLLLIALTAVGGAAVHHGLGHYASAFPIIGANVEEVLKYLYATTILYQLLIPLKKLVFLTLYLRLFPYRLIPLLTKITIAIVTIISTLFLLLTVLECRPLSATFTPSTTATCLPRYKIQYAWTAFSLLTDLWILALPIPALKTLKSPLARRISLAVLLSLAALFTAISAARAASLRRASDAKATGDATYAPTHVLVWSHVEASLGLMATCVPSLKTPVKRLWGVSMTAQRSLRSGVSQLSQLSSARGEKERREEWEREVRTMPSRPVSEERPLGLFHPSVESRGGSRAGSRADLRTSRRGSVATLAARKSGKTVRSARSGRRERGKSVDARSLKGRRSEDGGREKTLPCPSPAFPSPAWIGASGAGAAAWDKARQGSAGSTPLMGVGDSRERLLKPGSFSASNPSLAASIQQRQAKREAWDEVMHRSPSQPNVGTEAWKGREQRHVVQMRRQSDETQLSSLHPKGEDEESAVGADKERRHTTDAVLAAGGSPYGDVTALSYAMSWGSFEGEEGEEVRKMFRGL